MRNLFCLSLISILCSSVNLYTQQLRWSILNKVVSADSGAYGKFQAKGAVAIGKNILVYGGHVFNRTTPGNNDSSAPSIIISSDYGQSWRFAHFPSFDSATYKNITVLFNVCFLDSLIGIAVGERYVFRTKDGGYNWDTIPMPARGFQRFCRVASSDSRHVAISCFNSQNVFYSSDTGITWTKIDSSDRYTKSHFNTPLTWLGDSLLFSTMYDYFSSRPISRSRTWSRASSEWTTSTCNRGFSNPDSCQTIAILKILRVGKSQLVAIADSIYGTVSTTVSTVLESSDNGVHWGSVQGTLYHPARYIALQNFGDTLVVGASDGYALISYNAGRDWQALNTEPIWLDDKRTVRMSFQSMLFLNPTDAFAYNAGFTSYNDPLIYRLKDSPTAIVEENHIEPYSADLTLWVGTIKPNPVSALSFVELFVNSPLDRPTVSLYNIYGQLQDLEVVNAYDFQKGWTFYPFNASSLENGVYFLVLSRNGETRMKSFIVSK